MKEIESGGPLERARSNGRGSLEIRNREKKERTETKKEEEIT